jgi:lipoate-protein ligase A
MRIVPSPFTDIGRHLELEEILLDEAASRGPALLLYRNRRAVVFGKNQNAWREARPGRLAEMGVETARRSSGGGTVYHDEGNLNFSLILPRAEFNRERQFRVLLRTLSRLGLQAELRDGTSLCAGGLKFSGSAFALRRTAALHHGTFLLSSDLNAISRALEPPAWTVTGRGVASIRRPIVNLSQAAPDITADRLTARLIEECVVEWGEGLRPEVVGAESLRLVSEADRERWTAQDWAWGHSPDSILRGEARLPGPGPVSVQVAITGGRVQRVTLEAVGGAAPGAELSEAWTGRPFTPEGLPLNGFGPDDGWAVFLRCFLRGDAYHAP